MENHFNVSVMPEVLNRASSLGFLSPLDSRSTHCGNDGDVVTILRKLITGEGFSYSL
jgi:hypothetical protein